MVGRAPATHTGLLVCECEPDTGLVYRVARPDLPVVADYSPVGRGSPARFVALPHHPLPLPLPRETFPWPGFVVTFRFHTPTSAAARFCPDFPFTTTLHTMPATRSWLFDGTDDTGAGYYAFLPTPAAFSAPALRTPTTHAFTASAHLPVDWMAPLHGMPRRPHRCSFPRLVVGVDIAFPSGGGWIAVPGRTPIPRRPQDLLPHHCCYRWMGGSSTYWWTVGVWFIVRVTRPLDEGRICPFPTSGLPHTLPGATVRWLTHILPHHIRVLAGTPRPLLCHSRYHLILRPHSHTTHAVADDLGIARTTADHAYYPTHRYMVQPSSVSTFVPSLPGTSALLM